MFTGELHQGPNYFLSGIPFLLILWGKVEKVLEDSMDSIPSPSNSVKIQIIGMKGVKAKHCWALSTNMETKNLLTSSNNVLPLITSSKLFSPII